jgi:hypothetical protein
MWYNGGGIYAPKRNTVIRNSKFVPPAVPAANGDPHASIAMWYQPEDNANLVQSDRVFVYDYNQVAGNNFQVFYRSQSPDFIVPQTVGNQRIGAPVAGLTNQVTWDRYRIAIAGGITPCTTVVDRIIGFACQTGAVPDVPPTAPPPPVPAPPRNVRISTD